MDEITKEFLAESHEGLNRLERDLASLEKDPNELHTLASIFRTIHTIQGNSGFFGFETLQTVAHAAENLLSKIRDGMLCVTPEITSALRATGDAMRYLLSRVEAKNNTGDREFHDLIARLSACSLSS